MKDKFVLLNDGPSQTISFNGQNFKAGSTSCFYLLKDLPVGCLLPTDSENYLFSRMNYTHTTGPSQTTGLETLYIIGRVVGFVSASDLAHSVLCNVDSCTCTGKCTVAKLGRCASLCNGSSNVKAHKLIYVHVLSFNVHLQIMAKAPPS